jgi:hypothetical protein
MVNTSQKTRYSGHVAYTGKKKYASRILMGKPKGQWPLDT